MSGFPTQYVEQHLGKEHIVDDGRHVSYTEPTTSAPAAAEPAIFDVTLATDQELFDKGAELGVDFDGITSRPDAEEAVRQAIIAASQGE